MLVTLRIRVLSVWLMVALLVSLFPATAALADSAPYTESQAVELLQAYGIVRGDPSGNLNLNGRLTRTEAATIFVRSMAMDNLAQALRDVVPFPDAKAHWGAGEIAMAERLGLMRGGPEGTFRPNSDITYAEVLTVLLRMVQQEPTGPWNPDTILAQAQRFGLAPAGIDSRAPALRGKIFWSLATAISKVQLPSGETILKKHVDSTPPELVIADRAVTTTESYVSINGTAPGAFKVTVDGNPAAFNPRTSEFTYRANLEVGTNSLRVEAEDHAGNKASVIFTAERRARVSRLEIEGPATIRAGTSTKLTVTAYDATGTKVPLEGLEAQISGNVATFNTATTTLVAGNETGRGVLSLQIGSVRKTFSFEVTAKSADAHRLEIISINNGRAPAIGKETSVTVRVLDVDGKPVTDDYWRNVTLSSDGLSGVSISPSTAQTSGGMATFTLKGSREGTATLTAHSSGLQEASTIVQFLSSPRIVLSSTVTKLTPDGTSQATIRATLQDENGRTVTNGTDSDLVISLTATGADGTFTDDLITIRRRYSTSSGDDAVFRAGIRPGSAVITGQVVSGTDYGVQALTLPVTGDLPGDKIQFTYPTTRQTPGGSGATITIRIVDDRNRLVTTGSYAFQVAVASSNGEQVTGGLPEGTELTFSGSALRPMDDGRSASDSLNDPNAVVGRTHQGVATLTLRYNKSGVITVTPKLLGPVEDAYHPTSGYGPASGTAGMDAQPFQITFAGNPAGISLTGDSNLGNGQPGAATTAGRTVTLRAQVVDAYGNPVPGYTNYVTLTKTGSGTDVTDIVSSNRRPAVNGVAEFTVRASGSSGYDVYTASAEGWTSTGLTVSVRNEKADTPVIAAVRGVKEGNPSPTLGYVAPDDDYMDIQLQPQTPPDSNEPTYWVTAKVFRKGESAPFFTSGVVDLKSHLPIIRIPKSSLRGGRYVYEVTVNNGAGDTARSVDQGLSTAVNTTYYTGYRVNSGLYDAETGKLVLQTSGLATGGVFRKELISIVKDNNRVTLDSSEVDVISVSSSQVVLTLGGLASQITPEGFNGLVKIVTQDGWYENADGSQIAKGADTALIKPMGFIHYATLDADIRRLVLSGSGFQQGTLSLDFIKIGTVALRPGSSTSYDRVVALTDSQATIQLSTTTLNAILADQGAPLTVSAEMGWLRVGSGSSAYRTGAIDGTNRWVYTSAQVTSVAYNRTANTFTVNGKGFEGGTMDAQKLVFSASGVNGWRPDSGTIVTVVDDSSFTIKLSDSAGTQFESLFTGKNVFLNSDEGWLVSPRGLIAPIPQNSVLFFVPRP